MSVQECFLLQMLQQVIQVADAVAVEIEDEVEVLVAADGVVAVVGFEVDVADLVAAVVAALVPVAVFQVLL